MSSRVIGCRLLALALCVSAAVAGPAEAETLRVLDPEGDPVAGARIAVFRTPVTGSAVERASTRIFATVSGEDGAIDERLPQVDELVLLIDHPGFAPGVAEGPPGSLSVVRLGAGRSWSGRVRGPDDRPVPGGEVCVRFALEVPRLGREVDLERCGAIETGRVTVEGLPEGVSGRLRIRAPGYLALSSSYPLGEEERLVLEPGFLIAGRVIGAADEALAGVRVAVAEGGSVESDPQGEFAVRAPGVPAEVRFRSPGHREKALTVEEADPDEPLVVRLEPGPTLAARILGGDGERLDAGVARVLRFREERAEWSTVERVRIAPDPADPSEDGSATTRDDALEGSKPLELALDLPGQGEYRLLISARGYRQHREPTFDVGPAEHVDLGLIHLSRGGGVTARMMDSLSGEPVAGALGQLARTGTAGVLDGVGGGAPAAISDDEGHLSIVGQEAGVFELKLSHRDYGTRVLKVELDRDEVHDLGSVWLGPGTEVKGRVTDRAGNPRAGLQVRLLGSEAGSLSTVAERATRDDGRFAPVRLGAGEYRVEVHGDALLLDQGLTITEDEPELDLELTVGGTHWQGRVYRGDQPVTGGTLLVRPLSDTVHQRGRVMVTAPGMEPQLLGGSGATSRATVGREGRFELPDAPTGLVLATFLGEDGHEARERLIVPAEAEVHQDIRLTDSALEGVVRDAEGGAPLAGALLRLRDPTSTVVAKAVTGEDGAFQLTGFDLAGSFQLEAELEGYRPWLLRGIAVEEQDSPLEVLLDLAESSSLRVRLERSDGSPPARATISLFSEGGWMLRSLILDSYGEIVFDDLAPGRYHLLWHDPLTGTGVAPVEVGADSPAEFARTLQPGIPLSLECGEECAGSPPPAVAVLSDAGVDITSHLPAISPALRFSSTGRLVLGGVQPGTYVVRTWMGGVQEIQRVAARPGDPVAVSLGR